MGRHLRLGPPLEPARTSRSPTRGSRCRLSPPRRNGCTSGRWCWRCHAGVCSSSPRRRRASTGCRAAASCSRSGSGWTATASTPCSTSRPPTTRRAPSRSTRVSDCSCRCSRAVPFRSSADADDGGRDAAAAPADLDRRLDALHGRASAGRPTRAGGHGARWRGRLVTGDGHDGARRWRAAPGSTRRRPRRWPPPRSRRARGGRRDAGASRRSHPGRPRVDALSLASTRR